MARYRNLVGLPWTPIAEADLRDDPEAAADAPEDAEDERQAARAPKAVSLPPRRSLGELRAAHQEPEVDWRLPPPRDGAGRLVWTGVSVPHLLIDLTLLDELEQDLADLDALVWRWLVEEVLPFVASELCEDDRIADAYHVDALLQLLATTGSSVIVAKAA